MSDTIEVKRIPSEAQRAWLARGLGQPGGKLPLFDGDGKLVDARTIRSCIEQGWAEPWYANPLKPNWLVCKLTEAGRALADRPQRKPRAPRPRRLNNVHVLRPVPSRVQ
jgi:hypothetical protein